MLKIKEWNCSNCWVKVLKWILIINKWLCNECKNNKVINEDVKIIEDKDVEIETSDTYNWLQLYTSSYLTHKLKKNYNSIKEEKICIKYKDKYILHYDIIKQFRDGLK